jgi:hypothetical protein
VRLPLVAPSSHSSPPRTACKAALLLGSRADVLRRRPAARRRRISHSAQALPIASCTRAACAQCMHTGGPCTWVARQCPPPLARRSLVPSSLSTTSRAPRGHLLLCSLCLRAAAPCPPPCRALPRTVLTTPRPSHPQPSARNRLGERMDLLDYRTYTRPNAEVLPLITPAAARATNDGVRRISHATRSGQRRPVAKRSTGRGQGKGRRGRRRRGRTTPHIRHRSRAPRKHPIPHIRPTHLVAHPLLSLLLRSTHSTGGCPFTGPLCTAHRWRWCRRSSRRTRRPPCRRPMYAAPSPLPRG